MILTAFGLLLLVLPLVLVFCFENKIRGFLYIFIGLVFFHIVVAIITQFFGIFTYSVIIGINSLAVIGCLYFFIRHRKYWPTHNQPVKTVGNSRWIVVLAFCIVFFELFSVHYFYTGIITTFNGFNTVSESSYAYPLFSDEWAGVSLTEYSIRSHSLPLADSLNADAPFTNFMAPFFSVVAELFLLLNFNPLTGYPVFALITGLTICCLIYIYLRQKKVGRFASAFSVMAMPLIVNGSNLPGSWFFLPFIAGFIMFLVGLIALDSDLEGEQKIKGKYLFLIASGISIVLYPPMIIFILPATLFVFSWTELSLAFIIALVCGCIAAFSSSFFRDGLSVIMRTNLVGGIPSFPVWGIVPWSVLIFAVLGLFDAFRKKRYAFLATIACGAIFWLAYAFTTKVFIIDYPRIVVITSFLLVISAGFGFDWCIRKIQAKKYQVGIILLEIAVGCTFMFIALSYPLDLWAGLALHVPTSTGELVIYPASPISRYLTNDDIRLFSGISEKRFIAPPWKGLVVGAATNNYPLEIKPSMITVSEYSYASFMVLDCAGKVSVAKKMHIDYVYSSAFSCPDFVLEGTSSENLYLYAFLGK